LGTSICDLDCIALRKIFANNQQIEPICEVLDERVISLLCDCTG